MTRDAPTRRDTTAETASQYWDKNRSRVHDPAFWMAHPLCRQEINRRVTGSPHEWPLDWFKRVWAPTGFKRGVSWGCGLGAFERSAVKIGLVQTIDAFDVSTASLEDARRLANEEGIKGIRYSLGNFDAPEIPRDLYDIAFFHMSLHHVSTLERLFRRLTLALRPRGSIYVDEYIGPSRTEWNRGLLGAADAIFSLVPTAAKLSTEIDLPIQEDDPSEAIRSSEIEVFLRSFFDVVAWRPYGGQLLDLVMPDVSSDWANSAEGNVFIKAMLQMEQHELNLHPSSSHHVVAYGTLKTLSRRPLATWRAWRSEGNSAFSIGRPVARLATHFLKQLF